MYLFFDTETTGLPENRYAPLSDSDNWPLIVQIAWRQHDEARDLIAEKDYVIKPDGFIIPEESTMIHGITMKRALEEGFDLKPVMKEFADAIDGSKILVAHNMSFDEKIVGAEFIRENIEDRLFEKRNICTMMASTEYCKIPGPYGFKWPALSELYKCLFDIEIKETHDAASDVRICAECFFQLKHLGLV